MLKAGLPYILRPITVAPLLDVVTVSIDNPQRPGTGALCEKYSQLFHQLPQFTLVLLVQE